MSATPAMFSGAKLSPEGLYRFALWRGLWVDNPELVPGLGDALFVMNNPSTADARFDDPTVRRCINYARGWGYGKLYIANTNPTRGADPKKITRPPDAILQENLNWIVKLARQCQLVVAAWGTAADPELARQALAAIRGPGRRSVYVLELTAGGIPAHPLYQRKELRPKFFAERLAWP